MSDDYADSARCDAIAHAVEVTRRHPHIAKWHAVPDGDSAHEAVVQAWRNHRLTRAYVVRYARRCSERELEADLLDTAARFLELEDEQLAARWAHWSSRWDSWSQSMRDVFTALHARAAETGRLGGPRVLMSHRVLIEVIRARTGREYRLGTITNARVRLAGTGALAAVAGQPWEAGRRASATIYDLLPDCGIEQSLYPPHRGFVQLPWSPDPDCGEQPLPRPQLSDRDRGVLLGTVAVLSAQKRLAEERWKRGQKQQEERDDLMAERVVEPDTAPQPEVPDLGYLIDGWPPHTDFDETAYQAYQEGEDAQEPGAGRG